MKTRVITDFKVTENTIYFKVNPNHNQFDYEKVDNDKIQFEVKYDCTDNTLYWRYLPKFRNSKFESSSIYLNNFKYSGSFECIFYPEGLKLPYNHRKPLEWDITSIPNKKEAKLIWKNIKDKMSKPLYDKFIQAWDLQCKCGEWVSNPSIGYVRKAKPVHYNVFGPVYDSEKSFSYYYREKEPFIFEKVPSDEWFEEAWWTEEEYEAVRSMYKLDLKRYSEPEKVLANWLKDWPDFEDLYEKEGKEIDGVKKVTKHWYNAVKEGLIRCPICEDAYLMSKAIGYPPLRKKYRFYKIKEFFRKIFTK